MTEPSSSDCDLKREFQELAYMIVHHLKEPARAIRTGAELLMERGATTDAAGGPDAPSVASCVDRIMRGAARLDDITASIARYADDLGREDDAREETDTEAVLRAVRQKLQPLIDKTGATVSNGLMPKLACRSGRFASLLEHLLRNAILYQGQDPPAIQISSEDQGQTFLFSVRDNGIGIAPSELERVFEPFRRLGDKGYKGLGMGLTTSKRIVEEHGGRIWAESAPGAGATIFFTISK